MVRRLIVKEWVMALGLSLLLLFMASGSFVSSINGWLFDVGQSLSRPAADPAKNIAIVHLDQAYLSTLGGSQQERQGLALLLEKLRSAPGDICILAQLNEAQRNPALDGLAEIGEYVDQAKLSNSVKRKLTRMLRSESGKLDVDTRIVSAMRRLPHLILPLSEGRDAGKKKGWTVSSLFAAGISPLYTIDDAAIGAIITVPQSQFADRATGSGTLELLADNSGYVRGLTLVHEKEDKKSYAMPLLLAAGKPGVISAVSGEIGYGNSAIKSGRSHQGYFHLYPDSTFATYTLTQLFGGEVSISKIRGKTIIIAGDAAMNHRLQLSDNRSMNLAEIVALATANLKNYEIFTTTDLYGFGEWAIYLITALLLVLLMPFMRYVYCVALAAIMMLILAGTTGYLLLAQQLWLKTGLAIVLMGSGLALIGLIRVYTSQSARHRFDVAQTLRQLGLAYQEQGKKEQAFEAFKKLEPEDENLDLIYHLALDFERQRRYERAAAAYLHILQENPTFKDTAKRWENAEKMGVAALTSSGQFSHAILLMPDADGQKPHLGRYEVDKEIGKGAMGAVYLGRDPKIDRTVAIKTLALSQEFGPDEIKEVEGRFFHEAAAAGKLNHPNIVTIYDAGEEHDLAYIAMEYLDGVPLSNYTRASKLLPVPTVLEIIAQIADGLDYAAKEGVVHRDIKPANIMYNPKSSMVKITDFGIARLTSSSRTKTGTILGTPSYMSPEQITSQKVDGRTDIFSLGAMMFVLLTGKRPFDADSLAGLTFQITSEKHQDPLKIRPQLPSCIKAVVDKSLQKKPADRYKDGAAMKRAIERCLKTMG